VRGLILVVLLAGCAADDALVTCDAAVVAAVGSCADDGDCAGGLCGRDEVGGEVVTLSCRPGVPDDGARCAGAAECARGLCVAAGTCRAPCGECGEGERCAEVWVHASDAMQRAAVCVPRVTVTASRDLVRGSEVEVTPGLSVLSPCDARAREVRLRGRLGELWQDGVSGALNPVQGHAGKSVALWLPNGPRWAPGEERVVLTFDAEATFERYAMASGGGTRLDLDVFYVGIPDLAPGSEEVATAVAEARALLGPALEVGEVREHAVVGDPAARLAVIGMERGELPELDELFAMSAGVAGPSVSVFLVRSAGIFLGLSGGIPGPLGVPGTRASGVVLAAEMLRREGMLGKALAHELGHHLGLFHPVERDGFVQEPLDDTPECDDDANGDGTLSPEECEGAGGQNLMFWSIEGGDELTPAQTVQLRRAPILR